MELCKEIGIIPGIDGYFREYSNVDLDNCVILHCDVPVKDMNSETERSICIVLKYTLTLSPVN